MRAVKSRNTRPEICVRQAVYSLGYRFRIDDRRLPGRPDIVFRPKKKVIFVHGCFWHVHGRCPLSHMPAPRAWKAKLRENKIRDARVLRALKRFGWKSLVVWECELRAIDRVRQRLTAFLGSPRH